MSTNELGAPFDLGAEPGRQIPTARVWRNGDGSHQTVSTMKLETGDANDPTVNLCHEQRLQFLGNTVDGKPTFDE
ncbi:MAG TPA: hypothetical protein VMR20_04435 [Verrucomicrobiae bacterium]|nr:hypothetical protein [Verrucomicrobiae bacterium]